MKPQLHNLYKAKGLLSGLCLVSTITMLAISYHTVDASPMRLQITVTIQMYVLNSNGESLGVLCSPSSTAYGCTAFVGTRAYPYSSNPAIVQIEKDYLLDVVAQELSPEAYPHPIALRAQAVASRSYVNYYLNNPPTPAFNNSTQYQVFLPHRFDQLTPETTPNNGSDPCASTNLNSNQTMVCTAAAPQHYIALDGFDLAAKALFFADRPSQTADGTFDKAYLASVAEPISTICDTNTEGPGWGMSQEGAVRWARGNQCALPVSGDSPWSVRWTRPEQILFHYYTDVHLRNASSGNAILSPSRNSHGLLEA
jgi:hypothetical protein